MAHKIFEQDQWAYNRTSAWHNLGRTIDTDMNPTEALVHADLDWSTSFGDEHYAVINGIHVPINKTRTLYRLPRVGRDEDFIELGTFGSDYVPVQNTELAEIAWAFGDDAKVESCGSLINGAKVIMTLRAETLGLKNDVINKYVAIINGNDGLLGLVGLPTSVRIVCDNTLNLAMSTGRGSMFTAKHYKNIKQAIEEMKGAMRLYQATSSFFDESVKALDNKKMNKQLLTEFYSTIYSELNPKVDLKNPEKMQEAQDQIDAWTIAMEIEQLELEMNEPTLWLAANSVTKGIQFQNPKRQQAGWEERRAWNTLVGSEQKDSCLVMQKALELV